jgi:hypothetical protein
LLQNAKDFQFPRGVLARENGNGVEGLSKVVMLADQDWKRPGSGEVRIGSGVTGHPDRRRGQKHHDLERELPFVPAA